MVRNVNHEGEAEYAVKTDWGISPRIMVSILFLGWKLKLQDIWELMSRGQRDHPSQSYCIVVWCRTTLVRILEK